MLGIIILLLSFGQALAFRHMVSCLILEKVLCLQASPNHHASNTVLHSWYTEFVLMCSVWFLPNMALDLSPNISTLVSSVQSTMFNKSCDWFSCSFLNYNPCCHVLFFREKRLLATRQKKRVQCTQQRVSSQKQNQAAVFDSEAYVRLLKPAPKVMIFNI